MSRHEPLEPGAEPETAPLLSFERLGFAYEPTKPILEAFDWQVAVGDFWAILGPSGSGKTTLLHLIAGLRRVQQGELRLRGRPVLQPSREVGLMLQDYGLLPWYRARRNIEIGLEIRKLPAAERRARSQAWLERLGLTQVAQKFPGQLSGGQRQRVALARVLALEPAVLLLDEPLSAVDELTREGLQRQLWALSRESGATTLLVTHNIEEAALLASRVLLIRDYAPIRHYEALESPFAGIMPERSDPAFIAFCQAIRQRIGL